MEESRLSRVAGKVLVNVAGQHANTLLLSAELAAIVRLLGAQVIAEYEGVGHEPIDAPPEPLRTDRPSGGGSARRAG